MSWRGRRTDRGFTLLELMIVVTILAILAGVGVPQYASALRTARVGKARHELMTISHAIDAFTANNGGNLPLTLHQVGFGDKRDPWGQPYCYLNYTDGTGDGLDWAIAAGLVDPAALQSTNDAGSAGGGSDGSSGGSGGSSGSGGGGLLPGGTGGILPGGTGGLVPRRIGAPQGPVAVDSALVAAQNTATNITRTLGRVVSTAEIDSLAAAIAGTAGFQFFQGVPTETTRRRDRYMFPLNTDYDLFSLGPDCQTAVSLGESVGQDDVIRANNGGYFGPASQY